MHPRYFLPCLYNEKRGCTSIRDRDGNLTWYQFPTRKHELKSIELGGCKKEKEKEDDLKTLGFVQPSKPTNYIPNKNIKVIRITT